MEQKPASASQPVDVGQFKIGMRTLAGAVNIITSGFPATRSGDSDINTTVGLPGSCVAPIVFVLSGSEDKWFAVTGAETGSGAARPRR